MEKNKEDGMTDLEIIKKNFNIITDSESAGYDYWYELEKEALDAATRMAAEIERLKTALAKKPDIVKCVECKHLLDYDDCNAIECELEQFDYTNRAFINIGNLSCPEWAPREEKE